MKRAGLFVFVCISFILQSCASTSTDRNLKAEAFYKLGVAFLNENKIEPAFVEFHKALDLNPDNKEVLNAIGYIYLIHFDEPQKSLDYFTRAVKNDPEFSDAHNNIGYAYERMGKFEQAVAAYKKALSNPIYISASKAYVNLGNSFYRMHNYTEAMASYKESIKRDPDFFLPYLRLALCYNALGRYGEASTAISLAIKLDPLYKGDREKAIEEFTLKKIKATGPEEQDISDYLEILRY